jgi:hypothetical protein
MRMCMFRGGGEGSKELCCVVQGNGYGSSYCNDHISSNDYLGKCMEMGKLRMRNGKVRNGKAEMGSTEADHLVRYEVPNQGHFLRDRS